MLFMATRDASILYFGVNQSDHVHYFHGPPGCSYTYICIYPSGEVEELTLGSDVYNGQKLQISFPAGCFKAGRLQGSHCLIGEGVAPGFDFRDFTFCDEHMLDERLRLGLMSVSNSQHGHEGRSGAGREELGTAEAQQHEYLMKKYIAYVKPDRRRNFDDYYNHE
jgi:hypothetical protein